MFKQILIIAAALIATTTVHAQSERVKITFKKTLPLGADGRVWMQDAIPYYLGARGQATSLYGKKIPHLKNAPHCGILADVTQNTTKFDEKATLTGRLLKVNTTRNGILHSLYLVDFYEGHIRVANLICSSYDPYSARKPEQEAIKSEELTHEAVNKILGAYATVEPIQSGR